MKQTTLLHLIGGAAAVALPSTGKSASLDISYVKGPLTDTFYTVALDFINQTLPVLLDTGSDDILVASEQCPNTPKSGCYKSKLFQIPDDLKIVPNKTFFTIVGEGIVKGNQSFMDVGFGQITVKDLATPLIYKAVPNEFQQGAFSGILGMGLRNVSREEHFFHKLPPFDKMAADKLLAAPLFSITVPRYGDPSRATGKLTLGAIEAHPAKENLTYAPIISVRNLNLPGTPYDNQVWTQTLQAARFNGHNITLGNGNVAQDKKKYVTILDTGGLYMAFSANPLNEITKHIKGKKEVMPFQGFYFECSVPQLLELKFHGKWFPINPLDLITPGATKIVNGTLLCKSVINAGGTGFTDANFGPPFFRNVLAVFDYKTFAFETKQPQIGLASLTDAAAAIKAYPSMYKSRLHY